LARHRIHTLHPGGANRLPFLAAHVPHLGMRINGSRRWIAFGQFGFQPSEIAKIAAVFFLAAWFSPREKTRNTLFRGFLLPLTLVSLLLALIVTEVDLGTTVLIGATVLVVMFVAGANPIWLGLVSLTGMGGILFFATQISQRMGRLGQRPAENALSSVCAHGFHFPDHW
jgi:cell division protein FtsW